METGKYTLVLSLPTVLHNMSGMEFYVQVC